MNDLPISRLPENDVTDLVIFVGSHLTFSKHLLLILQSEHPDIKFLRVCNLRNLSESDALNGRALVTIVEDTIISPLMDDTDALVRLASGRRLSLAFRDPALARDLLKMCRKNKALKNIGVLSLNSEIEVWLSMINLLLCGELLYPSCVIEALYDQIPAGVSVQRDVQLTTREWEVLEKIAEGQQNKTIASELDLSEHTVKLHVHHLLKKLDVTNRTGAASWYANLGAVG